MSSTIQLKEGRDFTPAALVAFLQKRYSNKSCGSRFTLGDIYQYSLRGKLPDKYGGDIIQVVENNIIGIKILRLQ